MISDTRSAFKENIQLLEAVDTLFDELKLAFQWRQPSYLMSIYNSETIQKQAMTSLAKKLLVSGYAVEPIDASQIKFIDFIETIFADNPDDKKAFFIENIYPGLNLHELNLWRAFMCQRDDMPNKTVRLIIWLSEPDLIDLMQNYPDFWENRYRVIDLTDGNSTIFERGPQAEHAEPINSSAPANPGTDKMDDSLIQEVKELLSSGLLECENGDFHNACQFLHNAADLADVVQDSQLQVECQQALALAHTKMGNYDLAVEAYEIVLVHTPQNNLVWRNLGNLYYQLNEMGKAQKAFFQAIEIDEKDAISWDGIARVHHKNGLAEKAIGCYRQAINLAPDFADAWEGLGNILEENNQPGLAIKSYRKALSNDPARISTWIHLAHIYAVRGNSAGALAILLKAVEIHQNEILLWLELGNLYLNSANVSAAVDAFQKALTINPRHGHAYCKLAEAQKTAGNAADAISCYELGIGFIEDEQERAESLQNLLALRAEQNNHPRQAVLPVDASICLENVMVTEKAEPNEGLFAAAPAALPAVQQPESKVLSAADWNEVGNTYFVMGHYDQAISAYEAAIESSSEDFWPYIHNLATANLHKGKMDGQIQPEDEEPAMAETNLVEPEPEHVQILAEPVQDQPVQTPSQPVFTKSIPVVHGIVEAKDLPKNPGRRFAHLRPDQIEETGSKHNTAKPFCPSPIRNRKEWAIYLEYSDRILSSWTQHERNKLLLDAFLEQPRAEIRISKNNTKNDLVEAGMPVRLSNDAKYEKSVRVSNKKPLVAAPDHKTNAEDEIWAQAWVRQGNFLVKKGAYDDAATAFSMAISLAPGVGSTYNSLGLVYFHLEKYKDALSHFIKCVGLIDDPTEKATTWNYLGDTYRRLQDEEHALQAYQKAAELNSNGSPLKWRARNLLLSNCH